MSGPVIRTEVVQAPVTQILRRGTKASGTQKPRRRCRCDRRRPPAPIGVASLRQPRRTGSCAHLPLPFGTIVTIMASNGRAAQCRVGDRVREAWTGHIIDLNPDVFAALAPLGTGVIPVKLYICERVARDGADPRHDSCTARSSRPSPSRASVRLPRRSRTPPSHRSPRRRRRRGPGAEIGPGDRVAHGCAARRRRAVTASSSIGTWCRRCSRRSAPTRSPSSPATRCGRPRRRPR